MTRLKFPIGASDFKSIRLQGSEYVDKTMLIADLLNDDIQVLLFPRPRRFGKTLNLSTLRYFFDIRAHGAELFKGLKIAETPEFEKHQGRYPVIFVSFKDIKFQHLADATLGLQKCFSELYRTHDYLLEAITRKSDETYFHQVLEKSLTLVELSAAFQFLMQLLMEHTGQKVVVLLDEYDTPIHSAHVNGYYDEMVSFMRALMGAAFKDNSNLFKGVITGILRVSKEGMFSGLNNITVYSLLSDRCAQYFGFTQQEVDGLLQKVDRMDLHGQVRDWYNGFQFGALDIYNPWSIINFFGNDYKFQPYWVGTSDNALVKQILAEGSGSLKVDFEALIQGEEIVRTIDEYIVLPQLFSREDTAFSLLLFSGYLQVTHKELTDFGGYRCSLRIPNQEIRSLFRGFLMDFFNPERFSADRYRILLQSLVTGEIKVFHRLLNDYLLSCFSYFDVRQREPERFYHGFVLGLLVSLQDTHWVRSNRESGFGRYDVMIIPKDKTKYPLGILMEFKVAYDASEVEDEIEAAFQQIETKGYRAELISQGITQIQTMVMAFWGKEMKLVVR